MRLSHSTVAIVAFAASALGAQQARAELLIGWIFVSPTGSDSNQCTQKTQSAIIIPPTKPCKTITHACTLLKPNWRLLLLPGHYVENVVCKASGSDPINRVILVGQGPATYLHGVLGEHKPSLEITGSHINFGKIEVQGNDSDGIYIHGTDAAHPAVDVNVYYNTTSAGNAGSGVHANFTSGLKIYGDAIYNNGKECIFIENSTDWSIYGSSIFRCGSTSGVPVNPTVGTNVVNSPRGELEDSHGEYDVKTNLVLTNSPNAEVLNNKPNPRYPPFTVIVNPASDRETDTFSGN